MDHNQRKRPRTRGMVAEENNEKRRKEQQDGLQKDFQPGKIIGPYAIVVNQQLGKVKLEEDYQKPEVDGETGKVLSCSRDLWVVEEPLGEEIFVKQEEQEVLEDVGASDPESRKKIRMTPEAERCAEVLPTESPVLLVQLQNSLEAEKQKRMDVEKKLKEEQMKSQALARALLDCQVQVEKLEADAGSRMKQLKKEIANLRATTEVENDGRRQILSYSDATVNTDVEPCGSFKNFQKSKVLFPGVLSELITDPHPPKFVSIKFVDSFGLPLGPEKLTRKANRQELLKFLETFGSDVNCFNAELTGLLQFDPDWYTNFVSWIKLMPNIQTLAFSTPNHAWLTENVDLEPNELKFGKTDWYDKRVLLKVAMTKTIFPNLNSLKCVQFKYCYPAFVTAVLKAHPNLEKVCLEHIPDKKFNESNGRIVLEKLTTLEVSMNRSLLDDDEFKHHVKTWKPKKLKLDARELNIKNVTDLLEIFAERLEDLELTLAKEYECPIKSIDSRRPTARRSLPGRSVGRPSNSPPSPSGVIRMWPECKLNSVKCLTLNLSGPYPARCIRDIFECIEGQWESLVVKLYTWQEGQRFEGDKSCAEFFGYLDYPERTDIWEDNPHLKQLRLMRTAKFYEFNAEVNEEDVKWTSCMGDGDNVSTSGDK